MNRFVSTPVAAVLLSFVIGCAGVTRNPPEVASQEVARGEYCHKKLPAVGPAAPTMVQPAAGDIIDYYGPCDGPSLTEQRQHQRRFESFRFGRDYMDEG
ncbi:MAG TPA: hypothetical protein VMZ02_11480 [Candidatus Limnocylindrales bacterium]|nr:hypothetical protein [Candidatus Limnocylindrales bacterium]